jgi:hypothetical protein
MTKHFSIAVAMAASLAMSGFAVAQDAKPEEAAHVKPVTDYVNKNIKPWLSDPALIEAVNASSKKHATMNYEEIQQQDKDWVDKKPIRDEIMNNKTSAWLKEKMAAAPNGAVTEMFVMDNQGWNVGQTGGTSDMYQADEAKWQKTYPVGPDAVFVDKVEADEGKNVTQASLTVADSSGKPVGAITVGIDVDKVK